MVPCGLYFSLRPAAYGTGRRRYCHERFPETGGFASAAGCSATWRFRPRPSTKVTVMPSCTIFPAWLMIHTLLGTLLVASGTGTLNQYIERQFDAQMRRTNRRPIASGISYNVSDENTACGRSRKARWRPWVSRTNTLESRRLDPLRLCCPCRGVDVEGVAGEAGRCAVLAR